LATLNTKVASGESGTPADGLEAGHGCVPEPVSLVLMTTGLLGLMGVRRFRK
jgi:hypothetical protein